MTIKRIQQELQEFHRSPLSDFISVRPESEADLFSLHAVVRQREVVWKIDIHYAESHPFTHPKGLLLDHPHHPVLGRRGPSPLEDEVPFFSKWTPQCGLTDMLGSVAKWLQTEWDKGKFTSAEEEQPDAAHALVKCFHKTREGEKESIAVFQNVTDETLQVELYLNGKLLKECSGNQFAYTEVFLEELLELDILAVDPGKTVGFGPLEIEGETRKHDEFLPNKLIVPLRSDKKDIVSVEGCFLGERIVEFRTIRDGNQLVEQWMLSLGSDEGHRLGGPRNVQGGMPQKGGVRAPFWGVTLRQIGQLLVQTGFLPYADYHPPEEEMIEGKSKIMSSSLRDDICVYQFVREFVEPLTAKKGFGYALMINETKPLEVEIMVSHTWQEGILEFYYALQSAVADPDTPLFVCFLSIYQNLDTTAGVTISQQLGPDPSKGPFIEVLHNFKHNKKLRISNHDLKEIASARNEHAHRLKGNTSKPNMSCGFMLVVPCMQCNLYSRMWCCLELYTAINLGIPIFPTKLKSAILDCSVSSEMARCGAPGNTETNSDEKSIRSLIENGVGYQRMDRFLNSFSHVLNKLKHHAPRGRIEELEIETHNRRRRSVWGLKDSRSIPRSKEARRKHMLTKTQKESFGDKLYRELHH